jgi:hypothetical protein
LQQDIEELTRRFLQRERVPTHLVDEMMARSSTQVYWLDGSDLLTLGSGYSFWFEELMTARCGWDKDRYFKLLEEASEAPESQRSRLERRFADYAGRVQDCVNSLTRQAQLAPPSRPAFR